MLNLNGLLLFRVRSLRPEGRSPAVESGVANPIFSTDVYDAATTLKLIEDREDCRLCEAGRKHVHLVRGSRKQHSINVEFVSIQ